MALALPVAEGENDRQCRMSLSHALKGRRFDSTPQKVQRIVSAGVIRF